jgi:hypothetical protein
VTRIVATAKRDRKFHITCVFATEAAHGIHPVDGNLNIYYDQLSAFAQHIYDGDKAHRSTSAPHNAMVGAASMPQPTILPQKIQNCDSSSNLKN